jgi:hypothetical protein
MCGQFALRWLSWVLGRGGVLPRAQSRVQAYSLILAFSHCAFEADFDRFGFFEGLGARCQPGRSPSELVGESLEIIEVARDNREDLLGR